MTTTVPYNYWENKYFLSAFTYKFHSPSQNQISFYFKVQTSLGRKLAYIFIDICSQNINFNWDLKTRQDISFVKHCVLSLCTVVICCIQIIPLHKNSASLSLNFICLIIVTWLTTVWIFPISNKFYYQQRRSKNRKITIFIFYIFIFK